MSKESEPADESLRLELQEAAGTLRHQMQLLTQAASFIATADSVLTAYGFAQKHSGILLVASVMPLFMLVAYVEIMTHAAPFAYVGIRLERKLRLRDSPLLETYARARLAPLFKMTDRVSDLDESILYLRSRWLKMRSPKLIAIVFAGQLGLFLISVTVFHYSFM
jgi:hypothetical protein